MTSVLLVVVAAVVVADVADARLAPAFDLPWPAGSPSRTTR
jgi:hypothetical protein